VQVQVTAGKGISDVLCQHFGGGQMQVSVGKYMQVSVLVDVVSLCWGRLTKSLMASPVFFIKKKDGLLRLVQDYQALNVLTIKILYLLPLILELVNQLQGVKYFMKLNV
jgi:hypothetical protein